MDIKDSPTADEIRAQPRGKNAKSRGTGRES
jgi:hypothetical protein